MVRGLRLARIAGRPGEFFFRRVWPDVMDNGKRFDSNLLKPRVFVVNETTLAVAGLRCSPAPRPFAPAPRRQSISHQHGLRAGTETLPAFGDSPGAYSQNRLNFSCSSRPASANETTQRVAGLFACLRCRESFITPAG